MISELIKVFKGHGKLLVGVILANGLVAICKTTLDPLIMKWLIDEALTNRNLDFFLQVVVASVILAFALRFIQMGANLGRYRLINRIKRSRMLGSLTDFFAIPYTTIRDNGSGYFANRVFDEPGMVAEKSANLSVSVSEALLSLISAIGICLFLSWQVTIALLLTVPVLYIFALKFGRKIKDQSETENEFNAKLRTALNRCLDSVKMTRLFSLEARVTGSTTDALDNYLGANYARQRTSQIYLTWSNVFLALSETLVLVVTAAAVFFGALTVGGLLAYMSGFWKMMNALVTLVDKAPEFSNLAAFIQRAKELKDMGRAPVVNEVRHVQVDGLQFGYGDAVLLDGVSLRAAPGDRLMIAGANGTGKSSLLHVLCGFYEAKGEIAAPSQDRISAMLAPFGFFQGSFAEHLDYARRTAVEKVQIDAMLQDFGIHGLLDKDPALFSEGQKHKAYLAICLAKDADLYVLDEPLAAVDVESKDVLMRWIDRVTEGRMLFMVMHGDEKFHGLFDRRLSLDPPRALSLAS
ncbi:MAG: ABC transporter ATP-binding protein [Gammaproteobacteria bacterium]|nr:ABC transporter ATP-binding protein [Gammaproteobacteria bacterium]